MINIHAGTKQWYALCLITGIKFKTKKIIMKKTSLIMALCLTVISAAVSAQYNNGQNNGNYNNGRQYNNQSTVTINFTGNNTNDQVLIDGRNYTRGNRGNNGYNNNIQITDLQPGQHTVQVNSRNNAGGGIFGNIFGGRNSNNNATTFNVRYGYDTQLDINNNGRVRVRETRNASTRNNRNRNYSDNNNNNRDRDRDHDNRDRDHDNR